MNIEINDRENMQITVKRIGDDRNPVVVVDNFLANPEQVREAALGLQYSASNEYPGYVCPNVHKGLPQVIRWVYDYVLDELYPQLQMLRTAGEPTGRSRFSVFSPSRANRISSVHTDVANFVGCVLYLSEHEGSGTAFWRDTDSGLESYLAGSFVMLQKVEAMFGINLMGRVRDAYLRSPVLSHGELEKRMFERMPDEFVFPKDDHAGWQAVDHVPTRFNRLVFYHGWTIHSIYHENYQPPSSLEDGRMTMNIQIPWPFVQSSRSVADPIPGHETLRGYVM